MRLVIVSGRSGSGKSTALAVLEDNGFYCIDNLPAGLLPELAERALIHTELAQPLVAVVRDSGGNGVPGLTVTFTLPSGTIPLTFRLVPGTDRPRIEVTHPPTGRTWSA